MAPQNIVVTPTAPNLSTLNDGPLVAGRALKYRLHMAVSVYFQLSPYTYVSYWIGYIVGRTMCQVQTGGSYLMGRRITGKAHVHFNKTTELKSETLSPLPYWWNWAIPCFGMMANTQPAPGVQAFSARSKTYSATCQNVGSKNAPIDCNYPHRQMKDSKGKERPFLSQPEKGWAAFCFFSFFFF